MMTQILIGGVIVLLTLSSILAESFRQINLSNDLSVSIRSFDVGFATNHDSIMIERLLPKSTQNVQRPIIWKTDPVKPFLTLISAIQEQPAISNGNYQVKVQTSALTNKCTIDPKSLQTTPNQLTWTGQLLQCGSTSSVCEQVATYSATLNVLGLGEDGLDTIAQLSTAINVLSLSNTVEYHTVVHYECGKDESFHGFGETFGPLDMRGQVIPIVVSEQGVGRGLQPITSYLNQEVAEGVGGYWFTTYSPMAQYITSYNRSLQLEGTDIAYFDLTHAMDDGSVSLEVWSLSMTLRLGQQTSMAKVLQALTTFTGRQPPLPRWSQEGAVIGLEGGTANVSAAVDALLAANVPLVGVWLQDWVGRRHSWDGDRLIWNWQLNDDLYPNWMEMVNGWRAKGIRVLVYLNPFFSDPSNFTDTTDPNFKNFYQEGIQQGYFVHDSTNPQDPYLQQSLSITFATLDVTSPSAKDWMQTIIVNETLFGAQSSGFMCDFGEYLPLDAVTADGVDGKSGGEHNAFPERWAAIARSASDEYTAILNTRNPPQRPEDFENEVVFFMRAASIKSPAHVPLFWLGDQLQSWDRYDGLASLVAGAMSSGLSGMTVTHSDIGGYNAEIDVDGTSDMDYIRSAQLLLRWSEFAAFSGHALFRTHPGSVLSPRVTQVTDSLSLMTGFGRMASLYRLLGDYRWNLMAEASSKGMPVTRALFVHYPWDSNTWNLTSTLLFGQDVLYAPTVAENCNVTLVYLPAYSGNWIHLWTGRHISLANVHHGRYLVVPSPLGYPAVLLKEDSTIEKTLSRQLSDLGYTQGYSEEDSPNAWTWELNGLKDSFMTTVQSGKNDNVTRGFSPVNILLIVLALVGTLGLWAAFVVYSKKKRELRLLSQQRKDNNPGYFKLDTHEEA